MRQFHVMAGHLYRASKDAATWRRSLVWLCSLLLAFQLALPAPQTTAASSSIKTMLSAATVTDDVAHGGHPCGKGDATGFQHCFMSAGCASPAILGTPMPAQPGRFADEHWPMRVTLYRSQAVDPRLRPPQVSVLS
ncbi:MAG: hypothetical protein HYU58_21710 [Proteobacteria bacterium]|nr:hypothetical protein [Pseudomonadota bacterium]